jgi:hypothetical protein
MTTFPSPAENPPAFALWVKGKSVEELQELVDGTDRDAVIDGIFERMPDVFRADRAAALDVVAHWHVTGTPEGSENVYQVHVAGGRCTVTRSAGDSPKLTLRLNAVDFIRMATGNANARALFLRGRLKARGDLGLVNKFPSLFDVPRP